MIETAQPRANRGGDPCPSWCAIDHGRWNFHAAEMARVPAAPYRTIDVRAIRHDLPARPEIQVTGLGGAALGLDEAEGVADLIEHLAAASPEEHSQVAAAIRQAAALITEDGHG